MLRKESTIVDKWFYHNGDKKLRLDYKLNNESIVVDFGGYKGEWSYQIAKKFDCYIYIFEPVPNFYEGIKNLFLSNPKVKVYNYAVEDKSYIANITLDENGTSIYNKSLNKNVCIEVIDVIDALKMVNKGVIDLLKLNIEGSEYCVLEKLLKDQMINNIVNIQVQFHTNIPNFLERYEKIINELLKTHQLTFRYPFVWENWEKK